VKLGRLLRTGRCGETFCAAESEAGPRERVRALVAMANRKLQTDIDRALKAVQQGVELFDEIHEKVASSDTQAKKEKAEMELKNQIKKLQQTR